MISPGGVGFLLTHLLTIGGGVGSLILSTVFLGGETWQPLHGAGGGHPQDIFYSNFVEFVLFQSFFEVDEFSLKFQLLLYTV
jgi:hypothetical protein